MITSILFTLWLSLSQIRWKGRDGCIKEMQVSTLQAPNNDYINVTFGLNKVVYNLMYSKLKPCFSQDLKNHSKEQDRRWRLCILVFGQTANHHCRRYQLLSWENMVVYANLCLLQNYSWSFFCTGTIHKNKNFCIS